MSFFIFSTFSTCGSTKLTYSFWVKFQKSQIGKRTNIIRKYSSGSRAGLSFLWINNRFEFRFYLAANKRWDIIGFATPVNRVQWNQFTFTVDNDVGACAYVNGVKVKCQYTAVGDVFDVGYNTAVRIGGDWYAGSEPAIYFDDLAIWKILLTDDEIMKLYLDSRN